MSGTPAAENAERRTVTTRPEAAKDGIAFNAAHCAKALECAHTADSNGMQGMAESFRRLAAYHADRAWEWIPALHQGRTA